MPKNTQKLILILALLFIGTVGIFFLLKNSTFNDVNQYEKEQIITINENLIPTGWYKHSLNHNIILTRAIEMPDVGATEIYAYGDHILISDGDFDKTFENLEQWNNTRWVFEDEALVKDWQKMKIEGYDALRVEHKAAGADGEHLTYFIFLDDQFRSVSLYSQSMTEHINEFEQFVRDYTRSLNE